MSTENNKSDKTLEEIKISLNAIVALLIRNNFSDENKKINIGDAARFLHSMGIQPGQIAVMLGKKKASEISAHLYQKKK